MDKIEKTFNYKIGIACLAFLSLMIFVGEANASIPASMPQSVGGMAGQITESFSQLTKLMTGGAYIARIGFSIGAIMKFKAHKDNPTQVTVGTPVALVFIAAALLFLPSILNIAGITMFNNTSTVGPGGATI